LQGKGSADKIEYVNDTEPACDAATDALTGLIRALAALPEGVDDAVRIDRIRALEELKAAVAAAQARETAAFVASQRAAQQAAGVQSERIGRGIAAQVALARRMSPSAAQRYVGWCTILTSELPETFAALRAGRVSEARALTVAKETIWLSRAHRGQVDAELAPRLERLGDRAVEAEARKIGYRLDPQGFVARSQAAANDRRVSLRPAPDVMARLTVFAPAAQAVAAYAALTRAADTHTATGDERGRGQLMADLAIERLTGHANASDVPVEVAVVVGADTLLGIDDEPGHLHGYGPIPAATARDLIARPERAWLRRLFSRPDSGDLVTMETRRRLFTDSQRRFLRLRDQTCRTPWCDAPIRHTDHVQPVENGGPSRLDNGASLCAACNYAKQAPGWQAEPAGRTRIVITTPTGHRYHSRAPAPPGRPPESALEQRLRQLLAA
jgi:hypothetical protein